MRMKNTPLLLYVILFLALVLTSCNKEPLTVGDAIDLGELKGQNYVQIKDNIVVINDDESYVKVDSTSIVLQGMMLENDSIKIGSIIAKLSYSNNEDYTFYRKVMGINTLNGNTVISTEPVGFTEVFDRIKYSYRDKKNGLIVFRTDIYSEGFSFKPATPILIQEVKGTLSPDFDFGFTCDTVQSDIFIEYDQILGITPEIVINMVDAQISATIQICASGQVSAGYKNDKLVGGDYIPPMFAFPMIGMGIYFNPKVEALFKFKGTFCTPEVTLSTSKFNFSATINPITPSFTPNFSYAAGTGSLNVGSYLFGGKGSFEGLVGADIYASNLGPRSLHLLKAGVTIGGYSNLSAEAKGNIFNLVAETKYDASIGLGGKIFASAALFNSTVFNNATKVGLFWETSLIKFPILTYNGTIPNECDKDITTVNFSADGSNLNFTVNCSNCSGSKFYVSYNDSTIFENSGNLREFEYNTPYSIVPPGLFLIENLVTFQDKNSPGCIYNADFNDPSYGHDNCTVFTDPRDGDLYCTATIGSQTWLRENLRFDGAGGVWYNNEETVFNVFCGRLFTYDQVLGGDTPGGGQIQGICPPGYHLPSSQEFETLVNSIGGNFEAGTKLKYPSPSFWINTDLPSQGTFNAVGAGDYYPWRDHIFSVSEAFGGQTKYTYFWTSSVSTNSVGTTAPIVFRLSNNSGVTAGGVNLASIGLPTGINSWGVSCRCIQD